MDYTKTFNQLMSGIKKSIGDNDRLNYFKAELLKILDKKEAQENQLSKAIQIYFNDLHKTLNGIGLEKGRVGTIGEIRTWKDGKKYKKMPNGKWVRVYQEHNRSAEISIARLKGKIKNAQSVDELYNIVANNIHRFEDENGQILPIVEELKKEMSASKARINSSKPSTQDQIKKFQEQKAKEEIAKKKVSEKAKTTKKGKVNIKDFPEVVQKGVWKKEFQAMANYINNFENADENVVDLFKAFGQIKFDMPFSVKKAPKNAEYAGAFVVSIDRREFKPAITRLDLQHGVFNEDQGSYLAPIMLHEMVHLFDFNGRGIKDKHYGLSETDDRFLDAIESVEISDSELDKITNELTPGKAHLMSLIKDCNELNGELGELNQKFRKGMITHEEYLEQWNLISGQRDELNKTINIEHGKVMGEQFYGDIIDSLTGGKLKDRGLYGHGERYYKSLNGIPPLTTKEREYTRNKAKEIFANYAALCIFDKDRALKLKSEFPSVFENADRMIEQVKDNMIGGIA